MDVNEHERLSVSFRRKQITSFSGLINLCGRYWSSVIGDRMVDEFKSITKGLDQIWLDWGKGLVVYGVDSRTVESQWQSVYHVESLIQYTSASEGF
jgi:hypothetical protein